MKIAILVLHLFGGGRFLLVPGTVLHITIFPHEATDFTSSFLGKLFFTDVSNGFVAVVKIYNAKQLSETLTERKHSTAQWVCRCSRKISDVQIGRKGGNGIKVNGQVTANRFWKKKSRK